MTKALEALRFVKQAFLNDERWDYTDVGEMVNQAIAELEQQPKREWVGLTHEEIQEIALEVPMDAVRITEAKLKEKNT